MNGLRGIESRNSLWERALRHVGITRRNERIAAINADRRDYKISPESQAALARGDRQRATGVYEDSYLEGVKDEDSLTEAEDASWFFDHFVVEDPGFDTLEEKALDEEVCENIRAAVQEGRNHTSNVNED